VQAAGGDFDAEDVIGIGVTTTGSTPLPLDEDGVALAQRGNFRENLHAMAWLWKDHTAAAAAERITETAGRLRPQYLERCGGRYSSEWFWAKVLHCMHADRDVFDAAHTWVELSDWIPALLTGTTHPTRLRRNRCAAGHKALAAPEWGGYPDEEFIRELAPALLPLRQTLPDQTHTIAEPAGALSGGWAKKLGLPEGIPVAMGGVDAHLGAVGCGVRPGVFATVMGTSACDMMVVPGQRPAPDCEGLCGVVRGSILPGMWGLEAGQSAVGDIFDWFAERIRPGQPGEATHEALSASARSLSPGESGLLALDWHNGNRSVLGDPHLGGLLMGMTLGTTPAEIYRALVEGCAFGGRVILERLEQCAGGVERVVACGGIAVKNPTVMQIYADVMNRTVELAAGEQTCALGAAMAGVVVAGAEAGGHEDFAAATEAMTGTRARRYEPDRVAAQTYGRLYGLYRRLHDAFGREGGSGDMHGVMKDLHALRDEVRGGDEGPALPSPEKGARR
jgi:L-ribulokinase